MTPEHMAIGGLFTALSTVIGAVLRYLLAENRRLREALDESNRASIDLISIQARMLRDHGITPPRKGGDG